MRNRSFAILGILILAATVVIMKEKPVSLTCRIDSVSLPNGQSISVEIARTEKEREAGLSNRSSLATNHGMLFLFPESGIYPFWMKNTHIPLDIIWLQNQQVVELTSLEPQNGGNIPSYTPTQSANAVLEVSQGEAASLKVGDTLNWSACIAELPQ